MSVKVNVIKSTHNLPLVVELWDGAAEGGKADGYLVFNRDEWNAFIENVQKGHYNV